MSTSPAKPNTNSKTADSFYCSRHKKHHPTLEKEYEGDDVLLDLYKRKLPVKAWAGKMTCAEKEYAMRVSPGRQKAAERAREQFRARHQKVQLQQ